MTCVFMALQCFKCSTMQVKQRKKSSNKWSCVICNEKQSVRKVYSQGFMAKDVRVFVQKFNMSRQFLQQHQDLDQTTDQHLDVIQPHTKRTDWSEYVDQPDEDNTGIGYDDDGEGDLCEPNVVTELPKPLFKKPKLTNHYSPSGFDCEKLRKPVFGKKTGNKKIDISDKDPTTIAKQSFKNVDRSCVYKQSTSVMSKFQRPNSKPDACKVDQSFAYTGAGATSLMMKLKKPVSKWNDFIDDDDVDDDLQSESRCPEIKNDVFETKVSDEVVEDDVHPDFL